MPFLQAALLSIVAAIDPECQALIDANAQTLDLIRTIEIEYALEWINDSAKPSDQWSWSREGQRERVRRVNGDLQLTSDGRPRGITDRLTDGDTCKSLRNWNPQQPQKITLIEPGTVAAEVAPDTNGNALDPSKWLLFRVDSMPRRTLSELARVSPNVKCKGKVALNGRDLWLISLETPEETTATTRKTLFDVYLDPAAGYMIHTVVVNATVMQPGGRIVKDFHAHQVVEFKDFGDGVFVPMRVRNGQLDDWLTEFVVKKIKVNEPIPRETFEMQWPKYAHIRHLPPVDGRVRVVVWGDGQPLGEYKSVEEWNALKARLRKDPLIAADLGPESGVRPPDPISWMTKLSMALGALLAVMVGLILYRRVREQALA